LHLGLVLCLDRYGVPLLIEDRRQPFHDRQLPLADHVRVNLVLRSDLRDRLLATQGFLHNLGFEYGRKSSSHQIDPPKPCPELAPENWTER